MDNLYDVIVTYRPETGISQRTVRNVESVEIGQCQGVEHIDITYYPCGGCEKEDCPCDELSVYIAPDLVAEIEEIPRVNLEEEKKAEETS